MDFYSRLCGVQTHGLGSYFCNGLFQAFAEYRARDPAPLRNLGGADGFKDNLKLWLKDEDQAIRAFAAVLAGISGDDALAPELANLLEAERVTEVKNDNPRLIYDRGRAAMALGMIGTVRYKPTIALLLKSPNQYDRSGAMSALADFGAKEYTDEIVQIMLRSDFAIDDDPSPVNFLLSVGLAAKYKPQLAMALNKGFTELPTVAMYALVKVGAKEHARNIAQKLTGYSREDAMKSLALLGATKYSPLIANALKDKSGLRRSAAALSLGILRATNYADRVAILLSDSEGYVRVYAAKALLLMNAKKYNERALRELGPAKEGYFTLDLNPIVEEQQKQLEERLEKSIKATKAQPIK